MKFLFVTTFLAFTLSLAYAGERWEKTKKSVEGGIEKIEEKSKKMIQHRKQKMEEKKTKQSSKNK
jgi:hypothetical protein